MYIYDATKDGNKLITTDDLNFAKALSTNNAADLPKTGAFVIDSLAAGFTTEMEALPGAPTGYPAISKRLVVGGAQLDQAAFDAVAKNIEGEGARIRANTAFQGGDIEKNADFAAIAGTDGDAKLSDMEIGLGVLSRAGTTLDKDGKVVGDAVLNSLDFAQNKINADVVKSLHGFFASAAHYKAPDPAP
ncbi:MAG: hypothetical protein V4691_04530, partial [Pseudomonadota bacterium]